MNTSWLKCSFEAGMFQTEYAVEIETVECGVISFFASSDKVNEKESRIAVDLLQNDERGALVRLPSYPFEVSSRNVRVRQSDLVD